MRMPAVTNNTREARLRRMAKRQRLKLCRSRLRDVYAHGYGTYHLVDARTGEVVHSGDEDGYGLSLDEIEHYLTS